MRPDADNPPFIVDVEASGLGPWSYPIEVGVAMLPGSRYSSLVRPANGWDWWDPQAEGVHGISRDVLIAHGKRCTTVAAELNTLLVGKTVYSDGWVVDKPWINQLFHVAGTRMAFQLSPLERLMPPEQMVIWDATKLAVVEQLAVERHRASHDAMIVQETWQRTRRAVDAMSATPGASASAR